ncbi:MAG: HAD family hydrolase [Bacteroidales bacterium]|nr:HAD family hydrolase [Bacteroidales bacterium]
MIFVFDLDDTLYEELSFIKSGFKSVANYLSSKYRLPQDRVFHRLLEIFEQYGRGNTFDVLLSELGYYSKKEVLKCIKIYRYHPPNIKLYEDSEYFLKKLSNEKIYVVTDGNKYVQLNKAKYLGLNKYVKKIIPTRIYGIKYEKPSPFVFFKIAEWEKVTPANVVYFGDNPYKDFVGIKKHGFKTIRVLKGQYKNVYLTPEYEAHLKIESFFDVDIKQIN